MVFLIKRIGPFGESLFSKYPIFFWSASGQPLEIPALRIWMADHNQRDTLSWRKCQGRLRLKQTFFVAGFNQSHCH